MLPLQPLHQPLLFRVLEVRKSKSMTPKSDRVFCAA
jgi:hypothetical protein